MRNSLLLPEKSKWNKIESNGYMPNHQISPFKRPGVITHRYPRTRTVCTGMFSKRKGNQGRVTTMDSPNFFLPSTGHEAQLHFQSSRAVRWDHVSEKFQSMVWIQTHLYPARSSTLFLTQLPGRYRESSGGMLNVRRQTYIIEKFQVPKWNREGPSPPQLLPTYTG